MILRTSRKTGFTLIELLVVISIISVLASIMLVSLEGAKGRSYLSRAKVELVQIYTALSMYYDSNASTYPGDVDRDLPNGIERYLSSNVWPLAPWPGSVYDWDNWAPSDLSYPPFEQVYQVSIRFCPKDAASQSECRFPKEPWVDESWDTYSSTYYCISGPCRAHAGKPADYAGYCLMGSCPTP